MAAPDAPGLLLPLVIAHAHASVWGRPFHQSGVISDVIELVSYLPAAQLIAFQLAAFTDTSFARRRRLGGHVVDVRRSAASRSRLGGDFSANCRPSFRCGSAQAARLNAFAHEKVAAEFSAKLFTHPAGQFANSLHNSTWQGSSAANDSSGQSTGAGSNAATQGSGATHNSAR